MNDKVSIIIPVYNVELFVERCLESVINQTYENIEIIIINDGSTDGSMKLCEKYQERDTRIKLVSQNNMGLSAARNKGIELSKGNYICFIDSDDWVEKDYVKFGIDMITKTNAEVAVVGHYISNDYSDRIAYPGWTSRSEECLNKTEAIKLLIEDKKIKSHAWDKIFRKELFDNIRFPKDRNFEDVFIMHEIFDKCHTIVKCLQPKYHYYVRENSIAHNYKTSNILDYFDAQLARREYIKQHYLQFIPLQNTKLMELLLSYYPKFSSKGNNDKSEYAFEKKEFKRKCLKIEQWYKVAHTYFTDSKFNNMYKVYKISKVGFRFVSPMANIVLNKVKSSKYKSIIKAYLNKDKTFLNNMMKYKNKEKILLIGIPEYDNLGDVAIGCAETVFIEKNNKHDIPFLTITENNFWKYFKRIKESITEKDIIFIQGGGNLGNQYFDQERIRRKVISNFTNRIIIMPSTFYLTNFENTIEKYSSFYNKSNVTIYAREEYSYNILKKYFKNNIKIVPDIVLYLENIFDVAENKEGIGLCLRSDVESKLSLSQKEIIKTSLLKRKKKIYNFDTCIQENVPERDSFDILKKCIFEISQYELVITDKLHAFIFCAITHTPCIVMSNYNYKVLGVYKWIQNRNYLIYLESIDELNEKLDSILSEKEICNSTDLDVEFNALKEELR